MNALDSMIAVLTSPVAHRKGVTISAEDSKIWAEELRKYEEYITKELKEYYELKAIGAIFTSECAKKMG